MSILISFSILKLEIKIRSNFVLFLCTIKQKKKKIIFLNIV